MADQFDDARRVTAFCTEEAAWGLIQSPRDFAATVMARALSVSSSEGRAPRNRNNGGLPRTGSALEVAYVALDAGSAGRAALDELWAWWNSNVRGRIWEPPAAGLGFHLSPLPRAEAPYPKPEPSAAQWIPAVQQHEWWAAARRVEPGKRARRQAAQWAEIRDLAQPRYSEQIRSVLDVIDQYESPTAAAAATMNRRAALWA